MTPQPLRIAWLAQYPVSLLGDALRTARPPRSGHASSWIVHLSRALSERPDIDLHLVTQSQYVTRDQSLRHEGVTFHLVKSGIPLLHRGFPSAFPLDAATAFRVERRRLVRKLVALRPDLVHAHGTENAYALAAADSGFPALVSIQGIISELYRVRPTLRFRLVRGHERTAIRRLKCFGCRTAFDRAFVRGLHTDARLFELWEAIHPVFFERDWTVKEGHHILCVGSLVKHKGVDTLLRALAHVRRKKPGVVLTVVGGGTRDQRRTLQDLCADLGLTQAVRFPGSRSQEDIADLHHECDLFAIPSECDNSPNALAEAMVSGMPVVGTRVGGIPTMVEDGLTGRLVSMRQPEEMADTILDLLGNVELMSALGRRARETARPRHTPSTVADKCMEVYRDILGGDRHHEP